MVTLQSRQHEIPRMIGCCKFRTPAFCDAIAVPRGLTVDVAAVDFKIRGLCRMVFGANENALATTYTGKHLGKPIRTDRLKA